MPVGNAAEFARAFSVSHETVEKLELYGRLLIQWQKAVNLVAPATIPELWQRHFADSAHSSCVSLPARKYGWTWAPEGDSQRS